MLKKKSNPLFPHLNLPLHTVYALVGRIHYVVGRQGKEGKKWKGEKSIILLP